MAGVVGELRGMTKLDGNHIWNDFEAIESLLVYLKLQIGDWLGKLDPKNVLA